MKPAFHQIHKIAFEGSSSKDSLAFIRDIDFKDVSITSQRDVFLTDADGTHFENVRIEKKTGPALNQVRVKNSSLDLLK
jgi:hypothetical protein